MIKTQEERIKMKKQKFHLWYIPFAIIGLAIGIIRLIGTKKSYGIGKNISAVLSIYSYTR